MINATGCICLRLVYAKGLKAAAVFFLSIFVQIAVGATVRGPGPLPIAVSIKLLNIAEVSDSLQVDEQLRLFSTAIYSDLALAERHADAAVALAEKIRYVRGMVRAYRAKGEVLRIRASFSECQKFIDKSIFLSRKANNEIELAKCHIGMFWLSFAQGDYDNATKFNDSARVVAEKYSDREILGEVYGNLAIGAGLKGQHIEAIEYHLKAVDVFRALNDELQVGINLGRMGHTFELAGSYEKSLDYLHQALEIHRKYNNLFYAGWCLLNIGVAHSRIEPNNFELKRKYYQEALAMAEKTGDFRLKLACLDNIGGSYSVAKEFEKANVYLMKAYRLSKSAGHNSRTVFITGNLAENCLYMGDLDSALYFGKENLRIAIEEHNTFEKRQAYSVLSQVYAARNENKLAYDMLLRHTHISDSIFNVQKSQQIEDLREKYETEKKEQDIQLLTKEKAAAVFRRNSFASLAILFFVVGLLVFVILRLRMKKNQLLLQKEIELDRMKSRFFANISHEFRTPLTLILGPIDDMIMKTENEGLMRYLKPMRKNAARLLELVNQLLELSRIESGKLKPVLRRKDLVSLVKGVAMSFDSLAEIKNIQMEVSSSETSIELYSDQDKIEKILVNLLSNAFKFTPVGGIITVRIEMKKSGRLPGMGECLQVSVKDSGPGVPAQEIAYIFDRFYQADNNQLHQQDGSGIGLALTKELVELHNGAIWAESAAENGTVIHFQIPLNLDHVMTDCIDSEIPSASAANIHLRMAARDGVDPELPDAEAEAQKPLILLIEDHVDVRNYIRDILRESFSIVEAADGEQGVLLALEKIPDLILSDVMMPKMNGHQVCSRLKGEEKTSHIPIILLTARADMESRIEGLETKADDYLTKPFIPKELLLRITNLIESRRQLRHKYLQSMTLKPGDVSISSVDEKFLKRIMDLLEINMGNDKFGVEALGAEIGMSRSQLHRKLTALIGQGPNQFMRTFRLNRAHDLLKVNAATAAEIAYSVGFSSPSYFTKCFHEQFGYTPSEVSEKHSF